jgi:hypothetical protein
MFGIALAIMGAVTVVLSSNASDPPLSPEKLLEAISQHAFLIFSLVYVIGAFILMGLSEGGAGRRWVLVDVGLCALFGAQDPFIHAGPNIQRDIQVVSLYCRRKPSLRSSPLAVWRCLKNG